MSLTGSLSNALSGLSANAKGAQIVASNIANAMNENFGRRELVVTAMGADLGGGVRVAGVDRNSDPVLLAEKRAATAKLSAATLANDSLSKLANILGTSDSTDSVSGRLQNLEAALAFAEADPSSEMRLQRVVDAAIGLSDKLNEAQDQVSDVRSVADRNIAQSVENLNLMLSQVASLNRDIVTADVNGHDISGFHDQRQELIDRVAEMVPVRTIQQEHGAILLMTRRGATLADHNSAKLSFTKANTIMPHMTGMNGMLDTISVNGDPVDMLSGTSVLAGGSLEALFQIRDQGSLEMQAHLDSIALELAERFSDLPADTTSGPGMPGLFTDAGARAMTANEVGLSGRLSVNSNVDPKQGGFAWRVRSGLNAGAPNEAGNGGVLTNMLDALTENRTPSGSVFGQTADMFQQVAHSESWFASKGLRIEQSVSALGAHHAQLQEMQFAQGVDTDSEMQRLMEIEKNYAANAKVIDVVDQMLASILRIGS